MKHYIVPIKREIWEHTGIFIKTPIVVLGLIVLSLGFFLAVSDIGKMGHDFNFNVSVNYSADSEGARQFDYTDRVIDEVEATQLQKDTPFSNEHKSEFLAFANNVSYMLFVNLMLTFCIIYLLGSLLGDRKDGSVLFWKSMPVSETQNVLTKMAVATVVLPSIGWLAGLVLSVVLTVFAAIVALVLGADGALEAVFQGQSILGTAWQNVGSLIAVSLWLLPIFAWLLFCSAAASKTPFIFAFLPIIGLFLFEKMLLGTSELWLIVKSYLFLILPNSQQSMIFVPSWENLWNVLSTLQFWIGAIVSGALLSASIWLRNNRFEI